MGFPIDYRFKVTVGDSFRDPGCRDRFFRLVTNRLKEELARGLSLEGTRLSFKSSFLMGNFWFRTGRIELHTEESPMTVECVLSFRRLSVLFLLICDALVITSALLPETIPP